MGTSSTPSACDMKRVLIVDDMRINLLVLSAKMKKYNCLCEVADSAFQAIEIATTFKPDFVFTDLWMPEMNGDLLARHLKKMPDYKNIPIFVVTAESENSRGFDMSVFDGMLQKPIDDDRLQELLSFVAPATSAPAPQ